MIDHTGHPHPSTPKARALCRANGGTGFIGKIGAAAPVANKTDNGKAPSVPKPHTVNVKPPAPKKTPAKKKETDAVPAGHGIPKPAVVHKKEDTKVQMLKPGQMPTVAPGRGSSGNHIRPKSPDSFPAPKKAASGVLSTSSGNQRSITPKNFDKTKMEMKDGNGNWRKVASIETTQPGTNGSFRRQYIFRDADGKVIQSAVPNGKVDVRDIDIPRVSVPPPNLSGTMGGLIPPPTTSSGLSLDQIKIQNALRAGASRDFIKSKSKMSPDEVDRNIDRILTQYNVPNHVYPRKGIPGATPRQATAVKPATTSDLRTNLQKLKEGGRVEAPDVPESVTLQTVRHRNGQTDEGMKKRADRVLAVQEGVVGDHILRVQSIKTGIPTGGSFKGHENSNGTCLNGHIHIHKDFSGRAENEAWGRLTGFKTRGGDDPLEATLAHEMGHALLVNFDLSHDHRKAIAEAMIKELGLKDVPSVGGNGAWSLVRFDALVQNPENNKIIKRKVSKYAGTNANEFMAEIWADYTMNPHPKPETKRLGDVILGVVKKLPKQRRKSR